MRGTSKLTKMTVLAIGLIAMAGEITSAVAQRANIFQNTNVWKYMATPSDTAFCLNGTGWETSGFDDSSWPSAPGGFTGGETSAASLVGVTTTTLPAPTPSQGRPQYFRTHFTMGSIANTSLILSNRIDDQAVFYLNGTRVADYRHPTNPEDCTPGGAGGDEATVWIVITLTAQQLAGILQTGDNVLAVSVHQNATGSSDMVFVCQLWSELAAPVTITDTTGLSNRTVVACTTTTLSVGVSGSSPITFQWIKGGVDIDPAVNPTATNQSLVLSNFAQGDAGNYTVRVQNPLATVTSSPAAVLTFAPDTTPPTVSSVVGESDLITFLVTFSEPMDPQTLTDNFAYQIHAADNSDTLIIDNTITVVSPTQITLTTSLTPRNPGKNYLLIVNEDGSATISEACNTANVIGQNTITPIAVLVQAVGITDTQLWRYLDDNTDPGATWADVGFNDSAWPEAPAPFGDPITEPSPVPIRTELTRGPNAGTTDYTTAFFRTHFVNPGSGANATMSIRTTVDDGLVLYLNGVEIFRSNVVATATRTSYGGGVAGDIGTAYQGPFQFDVSNLTPGDNVLAAILYQADATSSDWVFGVEVNILVTNVSSGPISFIQQPQSLTINEGQNAFFSVTVDGGQPITYQWQKSTGGPFGDIPGATGAGYTIPNATPADNGQYHVVVTNPNGSQTSSAATLTVNADTTRPTLVSAAGTTNPATINLHFSRSISDTTGGSTASYQIVSVPGNAPLAVNSATVNNSNITLTTAARVSGTSYRLTITGLRDTTFTGNLLNPNPTVVDPLPQDILLLGYMTSSWRYNTNCQDGINWNAAGFDDSSWQQGLGAFGLETSVATLNQLPAGTNSIQTPLPTTPAVTPTPLISFYFRTSFDWPHDTSGVQFILNHVIDDGAIFYVNGAVSVVYNYTNPLPVVCSNLFSQPPGGDAVLMQTNLNGVVTGTQRGGRRSAPKLADQFGCSVRRRTHCARHLIWCGQAASDHRHRA